MARVTPGKHGYRLPNGQWVAPTEDFGYSENPYDPETQPELYNQWQGAHLGDAQQIGQNYSPGRVGAIIGGTVAGGALADFAAGAGGFSGGGSSLSGGAGAAGLPDPIVGALPAGVGTSGTLGTVPAATFGAPSGGAGGAGILGGTAAAPEEIANSAALAKGGAAAAGAGGSFLKALQMVAGLGTPIAQAVLSTRANNTARNQLLAATDQARTQNQQMYQGTAGALNTIYQGQQKALSPYTSLGSGAANLLGQGLGVPVTMPPVNPINPMPANVAPGIQAGQFRATPANNGITIPPTPGTPQVPFPQPGGGGGSVQMRAPTGEIGMVPAARVAEAKAKGAVMV